VIFTVAGAVSLTNVYADAVGDTVGILARVTTRTGLEPLVFPVFNRIGSTTMDFLGVGAIDGLLITGNTIIGKDFRTADNVGVGGGPAGVAFDSTGIYGYSGGIQKTFELLSGTGVVSVYGDGQFELRKADGTKVGSLDMAVVGGRDVIRILTVGATKDIILESGGYVFKVRGDGDFDVLNAAVLDIGTTSSRLILPQFNGADPDDGGGTPRAGDCWIRIDL